MVRSQIQIIKALCLVQTKQISQRLYDVQRIVIMQMIKKSKNIKTTRYPEFCIDKFSGQMPQIFLISNKLTDCCHIIVSPSCMVNSLFASMIRRMLALILQIQLYYPRDLSFYRDIIVQYTNTNQDQMKTKTKNRTIKPKNEKSSGTTPEKASKMDIRLFLTKKKAERLEKIKSVNNQANPRSS